MVELKRKLKEDYAQLLYALVATRACLLQVVPWLTPLSIFATTTSSTQPSCSASGSVPQYAGDNQSLRLRPGTLPRAAVVDECEYIKKKELDPNQHCLPNPAYTMSEKG